MQDLLHKISFVFFRAGTSASEKRNREADFCIRGMTDNIFLPTSRKPPNDSARADDTARE